MSAAIKSAKAARVIEANKLIKIISSYGRRFFYSERDDRVAHMTIDQRGHIYFHDDYNGKAIYTAYTGRWSGFSHGGTLKELVCAMADYIRTGEQIHIDWIGPERIRITDGNIWGYAPDEMAKCRADALSCGAIRPLATGEVQP